MKTTIIKSSIFFIVTLVVLSSCRKETAPGKYSSMADYFQQNKINSQTFTVNASTGGTITGTKGTVVTFQANAFKNAAGSIVSGTVNIELKEVLSRTDMIYAKVFPISTDALPLNSGGEFYLAATQNGNKLNVEKGKFFEVRLPAQAVANNMQFFAGVDSAGVINWQVPDSNFAVVDSQWVNSPVNSFTFTSVPDSSYVISIDTLGWCNADAYLNNIHHMLTCSFTFNESFEVNSSNTSAYALFDGTNGIWPLGAIPWGTISGSVINDTHLADIPMHIVIITLNNGNLYAGSLAVTPTDAGSYPIHLAPTTKEALDALIKSIH